MKLKYKSVGGYIARFAGGFAGVLATLGNVGFNETPLLKYVGCDMEGFLTPEQTISTMVVGGVLYFIGDRIHRRELEEKKIRALEKIAKSVGSQDSIVNQTYVDSE